MAVRFDHTAPEQHAFLETSATYTHAPAIGRELRASHSAQERVVGGPHFADDVWTSEAAIRAQVDAALANEIAVTGHSPTEYDVRVATESLPSVVVNGDYFSRPSADSALQAQVEAGLAEQARYTGGQ